MSNSRSAAASASSRRAGRHETSRDGGGEQAHRSLKQREFSGGPARFQAPSPDPSAPPASPPVPPSRPPCSSSAIASIFVTKGESNHSFQSGHMHSNTGSLLGRRPSLAARPRRGRAAVAGLCAGARQSSRPRSVYPAYIRARRAGTRGYSCVPAVPSSERRAAPHAITAGRFGFCQQARCGRAEGRTPARARQPTSRRLLKLQVSADMSQAELDEGLLAGSPAHSHTLQIESPRQLARQYSTGAKVQASKLV